MARPTAIPEKHHEQVLEWAGEGIGTREIAERLSKPPYRIKASHAAVARLLGKLRAERAEVRATVIAERVGKHVTRDLDVLDEILDLDMKALKDVASGDMGETIGPVTPRAAVLSQLSGRVHDIIKTKLQYCGVDGDAGETAAQKKRRVALEEQKIQAEIALTQARIKALGEGGEDKPTAIVVELRSLGDEPAPEPPPAEPK